MAIAGHDLAPSGVPPSASVHQLSDFYLPAASLRPYFSISPGRRACVHFHLFKWTIKYSSSSQFVPPAPLTDGGRRSCTQILSCLGLTGEISCKIIQKIQMEVRLSSVVGKWGERESKGVLKMSETCSNAVKGWRAAPKDDVWFYLVIKFLSGSLKAVT